VEAAARRGAAGQCGGGEAGCQQLADAARGVVAADALDGRLEVQEALLHHLGRDLRSKAAGDGGLVGAGKSRAKERRRRRGGVTQPARRHAMPSTTEDSRHRARQPEGKRVAPERVSS
jgi:hypothetical protein